MMKYDLACQFDKAIESSFQSLIIEFQESTERAPPVVKMGAGWAEGK